MNIRKVVVSLVAGASIVVGGQSASAESIVDFLVESGEDHSFEARKGLAAEKGIEGYKGTAKQNLTLLAHLQGEVPVSTTTATKTKQAETKPKKQNNENTTLTVEATSYTAFCEGCSGVTYTGIDLRANPNQKVIAVDPSVIPLGSRVYVEGYGEAIAADIGGAIKGHKIDVFIPSHQEALNWGRQTVEVIILD